MLSLLKLDGRPKLPIVRSAEAAECGLACLVMIARYHGHNVDLNGLRQRFPSSMAGATLKGVMTIADQLSLSTRAVRADLGAVKNLALPAILHWNLNHFVVLKSVTRKKLVVHDPAFGTRDCTWEAFSQHYTGVALEMSPTSTFEKIDDQRPLRIGDLWSGTTGATLALAQLLILSLALQLLAFASPFQIQLVVDQALLGGDRNLLVVIALAFGFIALLQSAIDWLRGWTMQILTSMASFQIMGNLIRHLMRLNADFFEKRHVGDIISRLQSSRSIQDIVTRGAVSAIIDGAFAALASVILFVYSPALAFIVVAAVVINALIAAAFYPAMRARSEMQLVAGAKEQTHLMESVRAATTIKLMGREANREAAWRNLFADVTNAAISVSRWSLSQSALQGATNSLQTVLVIYFGALNVLEGDGLSVGMLFAFLSFRQMFSDRANTLIGQFVQLRLIGMHLDRLGDIVQSASDPSECASISAPSGSIILEDVSFRYGATDRWILKNLNLDVEEGEFLAITGLSGGGKTTLLKIMLGLQNPNDGRVLLSGHEATPALWRAWRDHVGLVAQDDRLLSGTLADNISFFDPDLDMSKVIAAGAAARVHDEIMAMPMQYLSLVGDMGSSLSGGQKQRILLARALYRQPKILILDEGTANLDIETEDLIADFISSLPITRIVVAHRPALLRRAQRVLRLTPAGLELVS